MGWVVNATPRRLYPWETHPVPIALEAGWASDLPACSSVPQQTAPPRVSIRSRLGHKKSSVFELGCLGLHLSKEILGKLICIK
jgi:hypothetical protein